MPTKRSRISPGNRRLKYASAKRFFRRAVWRFFVVYLALARVPAQYAMLLHGKCHMRGCGRPHQVALEVACDAALVNVCKGDAVSTLRGVGRRNAERN